MDGMSMEPTLSNRDHFIFHPLSKGDRLKRGDLVLIQPPYYRSDTGLVRFTNMFLRIISFQQLQVTSWDRQPWEKSLTIKRVVALPGDQVSLSDYVVQVKSTDHEFFLSEFETSEHDYDILAPQRDNWPDIHPFDGNSYEIILNPGEFFVMGDNRESSSDSSSWGIMKEESLKGKIWIRYWPFKHAGRL